MSSQESQRLRQKFDEEKRNTKKYSTAFPRTKRNVFFIRQVEEQTTTPILSCWFFCAKTVCVCVCVCVKGGQQLGLKNVESTDSKSFLATPQTQSNKNWLFMGWNTSVFQKKKTLISKSLKMQSPSLFRLVPLNFLFVHEDFKKDLFIQTVCF
jgi:hypothetical protein